jgi:hypothetical protein
MRIQYLCSFIVVYWLVTFACSNPLLSVYVLLTRLDITMTPMFIPFFYSVNVCLVVVVRCCVYLFLANLIYGAGVVRFSGPILKYFMPAMNFLGVGSFCF